MADYVLEGEDQDIDEMDKFSDDGAKDNHNETDDMNDDPELEEIKKRMKEMEDQASKLNDIHHTLDTSVPSKNAAATAMSDEEKAETDTRSVYVGSVDYGSTAEQLEKHFSGCGAINRITILCDKFSGHPKGFAYVEFADKDSVTAALALDESVFRGRQLKVSVKRTNVPGISTTNRAPPRGRFRRHMAQLSSYGGYGGYRPRRRFSRFRRRPSYLYSPY